jgi:UbiD family decarboxylase
MTETLNDLRTYIKLLEREGELLIIDQEVDPNLEIAEIHRRVIARQGPALLFTRVKGSGFPVVTNLFGTNKRLELAFGRRPQQFVRDLVHLTETIMPLKMKKLWDNRHLFSEGLKIGLKEKSRGAIL